MTACAPMKLPGANFRSTSSKP